MGERLTENFLQLFCEKNSDGTKNLRLKGKDLSQRIGQRLVANDMYKVCRFLRNHPEIINLNLCYNDIGDDGLQILCDTYLDDFNNLKHLNLICCSITSTGFGKLFAIRDSLNVLKTLRLAGNKLTESGAMLAVFIESCKHLQYIDLGDCNQSFADIENILLKSMYSNLRVLNISRIIPEHCLYLMDTSKIAADIGDLLANNRSLIEFHAQKCEFDCHDIESILEGLKSNPAHPLQFLDLGYNNMGDYGMELLADFLRTRPNLIGLNAAGNGIGNSGAIALSLNMPFSKLRFLDLSYNEIKENGIVDILNTIKKPYMLRILFIWGNKFGHKANIIIQRLLRSKVLIQEYIDVKVYCVDNVLYAARYPADHYKHNYYQVMDHGCPVELKIKRNKVEKEEGEQSRALIRFQDFERFPNL